MPKCKAGLTEEDEVRLQALRHAACVGIADIEEGRFRTFDAPESLRGHLSQLPKTLSQTQPPRRRGVHEERASALELPLLGIVEKVPLGLILSRRASAVSKGGRHANAPSSVAFDPRKRELRPSIRGFAATQGEAERRVDQGMGDVTRSGASVSAGKTTGRMKWRLWTTIERIDR